MPKPIAGTVYVKVDGDQITLAGKCTCSPDSTELETVTGLSGVAGFKENHVIPYVEVEAYIQGEQITNLKEAEELVVTAELVSGSTCMINDARLVNKVELDASEGTATLRFEGLSGKWI